MPGLPKGEDEHRDPFFTHFRPRPSLSSRGPFALRDRLACHYHDAELKLLGSGMRLSLHGGCVVWLAIGAAAIVPLPAPAAAQVPPQTDCAALEAGPTRTVTRIIDGETVALDDGRELRLIGSLAPRAIDVGLEHGAWAMETKTRDALGDLLLGKSIELKFGGARTDRYGRLQAHAFLVEREQRRWVQHYLLANGLARAYAGAGNRACASELLAAERGARESRRGLWAEAAYQVRSAREIKELLGYRTTFQLVEGQVVRVALVRGAIYLNFERRWRHAFSVLLRREDRILLGDFAGNPNGLVGQRVRARGWIDQRDGPRIDLSAAGQLEVLTKAAQPEAR